MGEFKAGSWIIAILLYFFIFFTIMFSIINSMAVMGTTDSRVSMNDPGFQNRFSTFISEPECEGRPNTMNVFNIITCDSVENTHEETCNTINGCVWKNASNLFNITIFEAKCNGNLNKSYYNLQGTNRRTACANITTEDICDLIQCDWLNMSQQAELSVNLDDTKSLVSFWESVKWVTSFDANLGLGGFTFFFTFFFFYIPLMMLVWSIYMAIPFLH